jgi:hypothetical protein
LRLQKNQFFKYIGYLKLKNLTHKEKGMKERKVTSKNLDVVLDDILNKNNDNITYTPSPEQVTPENSININENYEENGNVGNKLEHKLDKINFNNGWNDKNEKIIISIGENAASYKWMHERSANKYQFCNKIVSVVLLVLSTGLSAETTIPSNNNGNNVAMEIVRRIFTYGITVLSVLQNFLKLEETSEKHLSAARDYSRLYHDIQQQMCMYRRDRKPAMSYVAQVLKIYDSLNVKGPTISDSIMNQLKKQNLNNNVSLPDVADKIQKIDKVTEEEHSDNNSIKKKVINLWKGTPKKTKDISNLETMHNAFQIQGDITDRDIELADPNELREYKRRILNQRANYEFLRFQSHDV